MAHLNWALNHLPDSLRHAKPERCGINYIQWRTPDGNTGVDLMGTDHGVRLSVVFDQKVLYRNEITSEASLSGLLVRAARFWDQEC